MYTIIIKRVTQKILKGYEIFNAHRGEDELYHTSFESDGPPSFKPIYKEGVEGTGGTLNLSDYYENYEGTDFRRKVDCIKAFRAMSGFGLREAKEFIEMCRGEHSDTKKPLFDIIVVL